MTAPDLQYWEALTLLRRLEKMSDEALRPVAPQILSLLRELSRFTQIDAERNPRRERKRSRPAGFAAQNATNENQFEAVA